MKVVGITGGVGAGKSTVLNFLKEEYNARIIEADQVGHLVMEPGTESYERILETFGRKIIRKDGTIDRGILGGIVFGDGKKLQALNGIVHPAVKAWIRREIEKERQEGACRLCIIEAALLIEDHYEELCEEFWYIYTKEEIRRERLKSSRGYTEEKITSIFANQQPEAVFRSHCRAVIDNNGSEKETIRQLRALAESRGWNLNKDGRGKGDIRA